MSKTKKSKPGASVVVEIGNDWLKIAQGEATKAGVSISKLYLEKFDNIAILSRSISTAYKKQKFSRQPVTGCIPRQLVNIRMLDLPSMDPDEIADMVDFQAGKQTPYSKDEIVFDYRIVGSQRDGYSKVMLAIVQRSILAQRFNILEEAGLSVDKMSVSTEGLYNWFSRAVPKPGAGAIVVLDVDSFYSDFSVMVDGIQIFSRSIMIGANKLLPGFEEWSDKFAREVKSSIESFQGESEKDASKLFITGAGLNIGGLAEYLAGQLGMPVKNMDCLKNVRKIPKTPSLKDPQYGFVSLTPVIGMGMAPDSLEFNLVPESVKLRKALVEKAGMLTTFAILLMAAIISISGFTTLKLFFKHAKLSDLRSSVLSTTPATVNAQKMQEVIKIVDRWRDPNTSAVTVLANVHSLVPDDMFFVTIDYNAQGNTVSLKGTAAMRSQVNAFVKNLEQSSFFRDAKTTAPTDSDKRSGRYNFQVGCRLEAQ